VRETCVVDGDTIWYRGEKIRLVGFDTPEVFSPGCARERQLGMAATRRLRDWLNAGAFTLEPNPEGRSRDRYDRALLVASRGGVNVGEVLLAEGLAERRGGGGNVWC
jgi:endonuclease YncB( thermonuclease family)